MRDALPSKHLVIRTSWLYGAAGPCFPRTILARAISDQEVNVITDQIGTPTWSADLAAATVALAEAGATGTVHFASRGHCSWYEFAVEICDELARRRGTVAVPVHPVLTADRPTAARRPRWSALDCHRYTEITGREPPRWRDALRRFMDHELEAMTGHGG